jgi:hypothetical protein
MKQKDKCPNCDGMKTMTADFCWDCSLINGRPKFHNTVKAEKKKWIALMEKWGEKLA